MENVHSFVTVSKGWPPLSLSGAGGGEKHPPSHTFAIPRKKLMGKVANFFFIFFQTLPRTYRVFFFRWYPPKKLGNLG